MICEDISSFHGIEGLFSEKGQASRWALVISVFSVSCSVWVTPMTRCTSLAVYGSLVCNYSSHGLGSACSIIVADCINYFRTKCILSDFISYGRVSLKETCPYCYPAVHIQSRLLGINMGAAEACGWHIWYIREANHFNIGAVAVLSKWTEMERLKVLGTVADFFKCLLQRPHNDVLNAVWLSVCAMFALIMGKEYDSVF